MTTLFTGSDENKDIPKVQEAEIVPKTTVPLSPFTQDFLKNRDQEISKFFSGAEQNVRVSEVLGSIAHLYEKIRNVVEYKGEHVLRRNAIERMLKRLLWEHAGHDVERIASILIRELIWARYIPNDFIPKSRVKDVGTIIAKYLYLLGRLQSKTTLPVSKLKDWIWGVASCEIEEAIDPSSREPYVQLMYSWFTTYFKWSDHLPDHEKEIQIYLAIHRALTKSDEEIMRYHLLVKEYPQWAQATQKDIDTVTENFFKLHEEIEKHLNFPESSDLFRIIKKHVAPFEILRDLVKEQGKNAAVIMADQEKFEWKVREICERKYAQIQKKVNRGIIRSILYIFVTKVVLAILIEVPYELYRFGTLTYIPIAINVIVPPASMWLLGLTIRAPGEENTQRILSQLKSIVYANPHPQQATFSLHRIKRGSLLLNVFSIFYLILFILVFGGVTYLLLQLHFTILGILIFFAFMSLVLLFGYRVRFTTQELKVTTEKENFFSYLFSNLTLPFLSTGVYLSKGLSKLNFFAIILDFFIEAPLKTIIEVVEEWTSFIREKREDVVEVPEP